MKSSKCLKTVSVSLLFTAATLVLYGAGLAGTRTFAQQPQGSTTPPPQAASAPQLPVDKYDRGAELWARQRIGTSSLQRGQEMYYMRCWMCHNEYTIAADQSPDFAAPTLRDLFKRPALRNGKPVTDETVTAEIRTGNSRMPAFTTATMSNQDLTDLLTYLKEKCGTYPTGGGCWDEHNPPPNPRYRYK